VDKQIILKKLFDLKTVLDRLAQTDTTLYEAISLDVEEANKLTDECIAEFSAESEDEPAG